MKIIALKNLANIYIEADKMQGMKWQRLIENLIESLELNETELSVLNNYIKKGEKNDNS